MMDHGATVPDALVSTHTIMTEFPFHPTLTLTWLEIPPLESCSARRFDSRPASTKVIKLASNREVLLSSSRAQAEIEESNVANFTFHVLLPRRFGACH